jgi:tRNA (mo5U34)-methyltransferase
MSDVWRPDELPGKRGFDLARRTLGSRVEPVVADFMSTDIGALGRFDVVLLLGVLYHLESPLEALRRLHAVTEEVAVIETQASEFGVGDTAPAAEFFPSAELGNDPTNWWSPNISALHGMLGAAGFRRAHTVRGPPRRHRLRLGRSRYRAVVHAWC